MALPERMKFGIFLGPFHRPGENPTLAIERDLELVQWLDTLGFDEAWIGEHHSGGWETISSPEIFIAVAAERTRNIKLGTGVISLPYHHPLMVANRMVLLDHLTKGRVMMGVGPGALVTDAHMMGIDTAVQRERMDEALGVILRLFTETEPVTHKSDWFELARSDAAAKALPESPCAHRGGRCAVTLGPGSGRQARGRDPVGERAQGLTRPDSHGIPVVRCRGVGGGAREDGAA